MLLPTQRCLAIHPLKPPKSDVLYLANYWSTHSLVKIGIGNKLLPINQYRYFGIGNWYWYNRHWYFGYRYLYWLNKLPESITNDTNILTN